MRVESMGGGGGELRGGGARGSRTEKDWSLGFTAPHLAKISGRPSSSGALYLWSGTNNTRAQLSSTDFAQREVTKKRTASNGGEEKLR